MNLVRTIWDRSHGRGAVGLDLQNPHYGSDYGATEESSSSVSASSFPLPSTSSVPQSLPSVGSDTAAAQAAQALEVSAENNRLLKRLSRVLAREFRGVNRRLNAHHRALEQHTGILGRLRNYFDFTPSTSAAADEQYVICSHNVLL